MLHLSGWGFNRKQLTWNIWLLRPRHSLHALEFVGIHFDEPREQRQPIFQD
jgi:hypothetical protein